MMLSVGTTVPAIRIGDQVRMDTRMIVCGIELDQVFLTAIRFDRTQDLVPSSPGILFHLIEIPGRKGG